MEGIIGIKLGKPGWKEFTIAPQIGGALTWAKGHFDAPTGRISVSWKVAGNALTMDVEIPSNARASFVIPKGWVGQADSVLESGKHKIQLKRG